MPLDSRCLRVLIASLCLLAMAAAPEEAPHFASVRRDQAYLREGPSYAHRILWIYKRRNYPVWIISAYGEWRHVRDADGAMGWMHHTQLSDRRSVLFASHAKTPLRASDERGSKI